MSFNPLVILHERQCAAIYNSLDSGRPKNALNECDAILSTQPDVHLASALKAIALCRLDRLSEANTVVDRLIKLRGDQLNSSLLVPLGIALSNLDREEDEADVLDTASQAHPNSIELASKACLAMARTRQWQRMQQIALRIHKLHSGSSSNSTPAKKRSGQAGLSNDLYFWWSMQAYCLKANDPSSQGYQLALPLAQRMIAKHVETKAFGSQSDEAMYLYARILQKQGKAGCKEALQLLTEDGMGQKLCARSMTLSALRFELQEEMEEWETILAQTLAEIESGNRNWALVVAAIKSALRHRDESKKHIALRKLDDTFARMAHENKKDRSARLAPICLVREMKGDKKCANVLQLDVVTLISSYFDDFSDKACAFEDLESSLSCLDKQERETLSQKFQKAFVIPPSPFDSLHALYKVMNAGKLLRQLQSAHEVDVASELKIALQFAQLYALSLPLSKDLPKTEMQPGDDLALLSAQALLHASAMQRRDPQLDPTVWRSTAYLASTLLHVSVTTSPKAYRLRILLIRILLQFGAVNAARQQYEALGLKGVQFETLGWIVANRFATSTLLLAPGSAEEREWLGTMRRMRSVWKEGRSQVPAMMCKALENGTFSRVEEMITFGDRLTHSVARYLHGVESERLFQLDINTGLDERQVQNERIEREKAVHSDRDSILSDQRDQRVLLNFLPPSLDETISSLSRTNADVGEPDKEYLTALSSLFSAVVKKPAESVSGLTSDEQALVQLGRFVHSPADTGAASQALTSMVNGLETMQTVERERKLPSEWLQSAAVAFEAICIVRKSARLADTDGGVDGVQVNIRQQANESLQTVRSVLRDTLASHKAANSATAASVALHVNNEWDAVLTKMSATQKGASILLREQMTQLNNGTSLALEALLSRIKATSLNDTS